MKKNNTLIDFYFGSITEKNRIEIEQQLLTDPEILLNYLDLKRSIESADQLAQGPSADFKNKLFAKIHPKRKLILSLSLGAALAASLLVAIFIYKSKDQGVSLDRENSNLYDLRNEPNVTSGVL